MNPDTGIVHVRPEDMSDEKWERHVEEQRLVPLPANRHERRAAAALARRSSIERGKAPPSKRRR